MVLPTTTVNQRNVESSSSDAVYERNHIINCVRGIRNKSKVSCHIICALQIVCNAIPPIQSVLRAIVNEKGNKTVPVRNGSSTSLFEELLDFVRICDEDAPKFWEPERLYDYLTKRSDSLSLDPNNVGDATRSLLCLLRLLSHEDGPCGPAWKRLLDVSIWEGQTRLTLEGRRRILFSDDASDGYPESNTIPATITSTEQEKVTNFDTAITTATNHISNATARHHSHARKFLQRIKPPLKNKSMPSPLTLTFHRLDGSTNPTVMRSTRNLNDASNSKDGTSLARSWNITDALCKISKPQRIQGSAYPWETQLPESYSEQILFCSDDSCQSVAANHSDSDSLSNSDGDSSDSSINDGSETDSGSSSSTTCTESNDDSQSMRDTNMDWITYKQIDICCIPRVWMLQLERPSLSIEKLRGVSDHLEMENTDGEDCEWLMDHVYVPTHLNPQLIFDKQNVAVSHSCTDHPKTEQSSPSHLYLTGAILQVIDIDDIGIDETDIDWEGGHSITLLSQKSSAHGPHSWVIADDDECYFISEEQALRRMGGVVETNICASSKHRKYYFATLLVYSIFEDDENEMWRLCKEDILSSWNSHIERVEAKEKAHEALVGRRLRIRWAKGKFYGGTITKYNASTGKHQVTYDDGDVKEYILAQKTVEWID